MEFMNTRAIASLRSWERKHGFKSTERLKHCTQGHLWVLSGSSRWSELFIVLCSLTMQFYWKMIIRYISIKKLWVSTFFLWKKSIGKLNLFISRWNLRRSCIHRYPIKVGFFFPFDIVDVLENLKNSNCSDYRNEFGSTNPQIATT